MPAPAEQTIVVVEDDANIADLLDLYLREAGFRVLLAPTGERALELVREHRPVLAVVDVGLPGIDGFEVCRRLRAAGPLPVLMLTARDGEIDRVLGLELGGRRLRDEAVLAARAGGPGEGDPAPGRRRDRPVGVLVVSPARSRSTSLAARCRVDGRAGALLAAREFDAAGLPRPRTGAWPCPGASSSTACGARTGTATSAPSTSTSASSARSWATRSRSPPCGASATGSS